MCKSEGLSKFRRKLDLYLSASTKKKSSKWVKNLNIKPETMELVEENIKVMLQDIGLGRDL